MNTKFYLRSFIVFVCLISSCERYEEYCFATEDAEIRNVTLEFKGVFLRKFEDKKNRGLLSMEIQIGSNKLIYTYDYSLDKTIYNEIHNGDSIFKHRGSMNILVKKNDTLKVYESYCDKLRYKFINDKLVNIKTGDTLRW
ncbi:MAG: hypothetical protein ACO1PI_08950 [Bacteroidota bacterium]